MEGLFTTASIGVGLAMDAFAAAICLGLTLKNADTKRKLTAIIMTPLFFGAFQGIMPLIGYFSARTFSDKIVEFSSYISFLILMIIGCKMIIDVIVTKDKSENSQSTFSIKELFLLSVATSIDSLAVGISFAFSSNNIFLDVLVIAAVTFIISFSGIYIFSKFANKIKISPEIIGGVILIIIAIKLLVS